jgi:hypothetical protein
MTKVIVACGNFAKAPKKKKDTGSNSDILHDVCLERFKISDM